MMIKDEAKIIGFKSAKEWESWLAKNHEKIDGIWLKFYKKSSGMATVTYAEALDVALCYGWIDGQLKKFDDKAWLHRFTPRRAKSIWSKRNTEHIARLIKEGRMKPAGLKQVEAAKADGRWDNAYHSPSTMTVPEDFLKELSKNKKAHSFYGTLKKSNIYAIAWRLQTAKKPETRQARIKTIIDMLNKGQAFHSVLKLKWKDQK